MKEYVYLKSYGKLEILQRNGNYALVKHSNGGKMCYNILGHEIIKENINLTLFDIIE